MSLPPIEIPLGAMRFNSDSQKFEYWMGSAWMQIKTFSPNLDGGVRGLIVGGISPTPSLARTDTVSFITISTQGNATDFGNLTGAAGRPGSCASNVRALRGGGYNNSSIVNIIDEHEFASTGNFNDFGDLTRSSNQIGSLSNATRGVWGGGNPETDTIDFVTIAASGNAVDFGNLQSSKQSPHGCANPTRGLWMGGEDSPTNVNTIDFITIATTGNAQDFGDLTVANRLGTGFSNSIRGFKATGDGQSGIIDFLIFESLGFII